MKKTCIAVLFLTLSSSVVLNAQAHERREAAVAASGTVHSVSGGTTIQIPGAYDTVFDALVTYLKKSGYTVDLASRDAGEVATSLEITGGWKQTGRRTVISVIKDTPTSTAVRIAATVQKRYNAIQADPWSDPKVDDKASAAFAQKVQTELPPTLVQN
jgi:hypothetical protein